MAILIWDNQCSPGLYTYWEGSGEENTFRLWPNVRGWVKPPHVTPHYWTAAEMLLLQLDMLGYVDESGAKPELVIGGGIPSRWLGQPMSVKGLPTKVGVVDWAWRNQKMQVMIRGGRRKVKLRLGTAFKLGTECRVEYVK